MTKKEITIKLLIKLGEEIDYAQKHGATEPKYTSIKNPSGSDYYITWNGSEYHINCISYKGNRTHWTLSEVFGKEVLING